MTKNDEKCKKIIRVAETLQAELEESVQEAQKFIERKSK